MAIVNAADWFSQGTFERWMGFEKTLWNWVWAPFSCLVSQRSLPGAHALITQYSTCCAFLPLPKFPPSEMCFPPFLGGWDSLETQLQGSGSSPWNSSVGHAGLLWSLLCFPV